MATGVSFTHTAWECPVEDILRVVRNLSRLSALQRTGLLDSPPDAAFDRLTRLATRILQAPVALVSLVD